MKFQCLDIIDGDDELIYVLGNKTSIYFCAESHLSITWDRDLDKKPIFVGEKLEHPDEWFLTMPTKEYIRSVQQITKLLK